MATPRTVDRSKPLICGHCEEPFMAKPSGPLPKYCTPTCKARACDIRAMMDGRMDAWGVAAKERRVVALLERMAQCPSCGVVFAPGRRTRTYCTSQCQMRAYNRRREEDGRLARYRAERRQRERAQADPSEVFRAVDIYERDAWTCQICAGPLSRHARWPAPDSPSVDHVVPLSKGGSHTLANVQAAHLRCNLVKGDRVEAA